MSKKKILKMTCRKMDNRLVEIRQEYARMGVSAQWVSDYVRLLPFHHEMPLSLLLPDGTMPHEEYMKKLAGLVERMETGNEVVCKETSHKLRMHLTECKPIDSNAFHEKMRVLVDEEHRILTNTRIQEVGAMVATSSAAHAAHGAGRARISEAEKGERACELDAGDS